MCGSTLRDVPMTSTIESYKTNSRFHNPAADRILRSFGKLTSTMSLAGTSMSSFAPQSGRLSPGHWSPSSGLSPVDACHSPFNPSSSLGQSPRIALARLSHQRQLSGSDNGASASPRKVSEVAKTSKLHGGYFMCECCPKKPKKFETDQELRYASKSTLTLYIA